MLGDGSRRLILRDCRGSRQDGGQSRTDRRLVQHHRFLLIIQRYGIPASMDQGFSCTADLASIRFERERKVDIALLDSLSEMQNASLINARWKISRFKNPYLVGDACRRRFECNRKDKGEDDRPRRAVTDHNLIGFLQAESPCTGFFLCVTSQQQIWRVAGKLTESLIAKARKTCTAMNFSSGLRAAEFSFL